MDKLDQAERERARLWDDMNFDAFAEVLALEEACELAAQIAFECFPGVDEDPEQGILIENLKGELSDRFHRAVSLVKAFVLQ